MPHNSGLDLMPPWFDQPTRLPDGVAITGNAGARVASRGTPFQVPTYCSSTGGSVACCRPSAPSTSA